MSYNLDQMKLEALGPSSQVTLFDLEGKLIKSCNTLLQTEKSSSIFEQFYFLLSIQEAIQTLELNHPLVFEAIEWQEQRTGLFHIWIERIETNIIRWLIIDKTAERDQILSIQQSRNNATINEELLEIRQKYLEAEQKLLSFQNEELQRIQKFKERFFAEVSHEMRTPLNSISGLVSLLETVPEEDSQTYLSALKATSNHLNHIINDLLDLAKVEEGKLQLQPLSFNLNEVVENVIKGFLMTAEEKGIYLKLEIESTVPELIKTDPIRLSQVLYNIIGNAIKFTHEGGVNLLIHSNNSDEYTPQLQFKIEDTGIGMPEESIQNIMEPYTQAEGQSFYDYGGTGLGMGIAQKLIEKLGGSLKIKSERGQGTTVSFLINYETANSINYNVKTDKHSPLSIDLSGYSILVAEDDTLSQLMLKESINQWNLKSHFVASVLDMKQALNLQNFDLIISDINLSDGSAITTIKKLRREPSYHKNIPVIFISGESLEAQPELSQMKRTSFLMKPISPNILQAKISEMIRLSKKAKLEPVDLTSLKNSAQENVPFMIELIETILEYLPKDLEKLSWAVHSKDFEGARKLLHKIKPSISYLGIESLLVERNKLYDLTLDKRPIDDLLDPFKAKIDMALKDLKAQKIKLAATLN